MTDPGSPCTSVCRIEPTTGWCEGCMRTIDEIVAWGTMSVADKRRVWADLAQRRARTVASPVAAATPPDRS